MKQSLEQREAGRARAEARAWRLIARSIDERGLIGVGLCREIYELDRTGAVVSDQVLGSMSMRVKFHLDDGRGVIQWWDENALNTPVRRAVEVRILAALFLALECADEAKSLLSGEDEASASLGMKKV